MANNEFGPEPDGNGPVSVMVTLGRLGAARQLAAATARRMGMRPSLIPDTIIAINEITTNAVTHGRAPARLRIWRDNGDLVVEVRDRGHWTNPATVVAGDLSADLPLKPVPGGRGLWIARTIARTLTADTTADTAMSTANASTRVTLRFALT
ncbi:ATP-binding protein [Nonomuraea sp. NPDC050394]|uniref:ATP-binding protein n=1 Tax=Nonomuraea sp. NPDC050394 TaxID=3364363 RepID=UPI0037A22284